MATHPDWLRMASKTQNFRFSLLGYVHDDATITHCYCCFVKILCFLQAFDMHDFSRPIGCKYNFDVYIINVELLIRHFLVCTPRAHLSSIPKFCFVVICYILSHFISFSIIPIEQ